MGLKWFDSRSLIPLVLLLLISSCNTQPKISEDQFILSAYHEGTFSKRKFSLLKDSTYHFYRNVHTNTFNLAGKWKRQADSFYLFDTLYNTYYGKVYLKEGGTEFEINPTDSTLFDFTHSNFRIKVWKQKIK